MAVGLISAARWTTQRRRQRRNGLSQVKAMEDGTLEEVEEHKRKKKRKLDASTNGEDTPPVKICTYCNNITV